MLRPRFHCVAHGLGLVLAVSPALAVAAETAPPPLQNAPAVSATSAPPAAAPAPAALPAAAPPAAAPSATAAASAVAADGSGTLDAALQRVLKPHCADDTAALRSAALQADPRERAFLARIVRLCDALQAQDGERREPEEGVDRSGRARLVVGATGYGLWAGIAADVLLEIDDARTSVVPPLVGVGVGLGASLLATSEGEITRGQAWTVITGLDYGTYSGFLLAGAAEWDEAKQIVGVALGSGLLGGAIGSGVAHYLRPTAGDAEVVRSGGLWGFASAGLLAAAIDPDDEQQLFGIMLAGMDGGLLTGALLADRYAISRSRMLLGDTGALAGGVAGLGVGILAVGGPTGDEGRVVAIASLIGLHAGLGLSLYLTRDMEEEGEERDDEQARGAHEPPAALYVHESAGDWRPGRLAIQPALDATRAGVRPVGAWLPLLGGYW